MTEDDFLRCLDGNTLDGVEVLLDEASAVMSAAVPAAPIRRNKTTESLEPKPVKPPRALRRKPIPTDQVCSEAGCDETAAFKTRTKPTWCSTHIAEIQLAGGLRALESFTHPDDWQLTECVACGVEAHYRFAYTLDKNQYSEPTCRACYWRSWAAEERRMQGEWANLTPVSFEEAQAHAEAHDFDYLGPLTAPSYGSDPHRTRCRRCGKISADRLGDIGFGCTCQPRG